MRTGPKLKGAEAPRLFTPPRCVRFTKRTTLGLEVIDFAETILGIDLWPWQKWWLKHALELNENGELRFKVIITLVGRQNGKTSLMVVIALWAMYTGRADLVLGAAQTLDTAREAWRGAIDIARADPELAAEVAAVRSGNNDPTLELISGARYKICAASGSAGRGLSVDLLCLDELRQHRNWDAWGALSKTTMARPGALILGFSNAGDFGSVVLNDLREKALAGEDPTLAIFEWSAPEGCELDDPAAWAQANPGLGHGRLTETAIQTALATDPPAVFRTEVLCQRVDQLEGAVDLHAWKAGHDPAGSLAGLRDRVVACVDVAPGGAHVSLALAAVLADDRVRVEMAGAWDSTEDARRALPDLLARIAPRAVAWFPGGPAAGLVDVLKGSGFRERLGDEPPVEIKGGAVSEACQGFADLVRSRRVLHPGDPLLDAHVAGASKLNQGDGWRFVRKGAGHVDAAYAAAGAIHTALTLPPLPPTPPRWFIV